jgi:hypothetical protein
MDFPRNFVSFEPVQQELIYQGVLKANIDDWVDLDISERGLTVKETEAQITRLFFGIIYHLNNPILSFPATTLCPPLVNKISLKAHHAIHQLGSGSVPLNAIIEKPKFSREYRQVILKAKTIITTPCMEFPFCIFGSVDQSSNKYNLREFTVKLTLPDFYKFKRPFVEMYMDFPKNTAQICRFQIAKYEEYLKISVQTQVLLFNNTLDPMYINSAFENIKYTDFKLLKPNNLRINAIFLSTEQLSLKLPFHSLSSTKLKTLDKFKDTTKPFFKDLLNLESKCVMTDSRFTQMANSNTTTLQVRNNLISDKRNLTFNDKETTNLEAQNTKALSQSSLSPSYNFSQHFIQLPPVQPAFANFQDLATLERPLKKRKVDTTEINLVQK